MTTVRPLTLLGLTCRNLYRQKLRTSLTILGVAVGIVAMVAFTAVVRGMWRASQSSITAGGTDLLVFQSGVAADFFSVLNEEKTRAALMEIPDIQDVAAALTHIMPVEGHPLFLVFGVHPDEYSARNNYIVEGRAIQAEDEILLGRLAKKALNKTIGGTVTLGGKQYRVVGIFETEVVFYNGAIVMDLPVLQKLARKAGLVSTFQIKVRPSVKPLEVSWKIEQKHRDLVAIGGAAQYNKVDAGLDIVDALQFAVSVLATFVGGLIVLNTMWMSVHERTREIGVLRSIGWSKGRIIGMILSESCGVGLIACLVGSPLGFVLASLTTKWSLASRFVQPVFDAAPVIGALCVAIALSIMGGLAPAWRAARISPVEALRYE